MTTSRLAVVPPHGDGAAFVSDPDTRAVRIARLQAEARMLATDQIEAFAEVLSKVAAMSKEIAEGGDAYPVGVRQLAERLAQSLPVQAQTLQAITARTS